MQHFDEPPVPLEILLRERRRGGSVGGASGAGGDQQGEDGDWSRQLSSLQAASRKDVLRPAVGDGFRLAVAGISIGIALAVALSRVLRGMLFGVSAFDPLS